MKKHKFTVKGMHCVGCAMSVDSALEDVPGVKSAAANYAKQFVEIEYDEKKVAETDMVEAVKQAGYTLVLGE
ncbi:MAG: heavy-metal-associated domain-containing protein [Anaerolineae bacterium]|nr:heavy-metal-associated domain-containing protein [Anaerolineae bacterium]